MLENYNIEDLLIGKLVITSNLGGFYGTITDTKGPFIFYKTGEKYSEIFTEEEYQLGLKSFPSTGGKKYTLSVNVEENEFGKTYIMREDTILKYLNEEELFHYETFKKDGKKATITKMRLLEIYNEIQKNYIIHNLRREKEEQVFERQYTKNHLSN